MSPRARSIEGRRRRRTVTAAGPERVPVTASAGEPACPKHMVFGPCGGVQPDGSCEIGGACPFVGPSAVSVPPVAAAAPSTRTPAADELRLLMERRPIVVADLPSAGPDADLERRLASTLAGHVDAALLGDAPWARLQFPPSMRARLVAAEGLRPWSGLNCRDRNRVALQAELAALAASGVGAVHCVTGDYPRIEPDGIPGVFDLDSTQLATHAAATGMLVSVAESPSAPPIAGRPARAAAKGTAGADLCFVNHAGSTGDLTEFVARTRELAPQLRIIVCVPMVLSQSGADRLAEFFPGALPPSVAAALSSANPAAAAIAAAVAASTRLLEIDGVDGVDLSAPPAQGEELLVAEALASVGRALGGGA